MVTNTEVRQAFANGRTGVSNDTGSMKTVSARNGDTLLVGYNHAIYAERDSDSGSITVHEGWADWAYNQNPNAEATPRHIREVKSLADSVTQRTPSADSAPESIADIGRFGLRSDE